MTDNADNFVQKYSPDGKLLLTLGKRGVAGGNDSKDAFDGPADVFVMADGDIVVADGYRNSRIVRFSDDGMFKSIIGGTKGPSRDSSTSPMPSSSIHVVGSSSRTRRTAGSRCSIKAASSSNNGPTSPPSPEGRCSSPPTTRFT